MTRFGQVPQTIRNKQSPWLRFDFEKGNRVTRTCERCGASETFPIGQQRGQVAWMETHAQCQEEPCPKNR